MKIKVGMIGLGFMGSAHARVYSRLKDCKLIAIYYKDLTKKQLT